MEIFTIVSLVFGFFLLLGFGLGMLRSWKRSLIRLAILVGDFIVSLFVSPLIAKAVIKNVAHGTTISFFNFNIDFSEIIEGFTGGDIAADLVSAESTTNQVTTALVNMIANLLLFFVIFLLIWLISLIIYWIVLGVVSHGRKKKVKGGEEVAEKHHQNIGFRFIGGFVGLVSTLVMFAALLVPVFGAVNICNKFVDSDKAQTASALSLESKLASSEYYTEDEKIGAVETYIEKYADIKRSYDKSFAGAIFNYTGMSFIGNASFKYLTNVSSGDLKLSLTNETVAIIDTYNAYKQAFVENEFDITSNDSIDRVAALYNKAVNSKIVSSYIVELVPTMSTRWSSGEKFLGMESPFTGEFEPIVSQILQVFTVKSNERINANITVLFNVIKVANNNNLIKAIKDKTNLVDYLGGNTTLIKDLILVLTTTEEFKNNLPKTTNEMLKVLYNQIVGGVNPIKDLSETQVHNIDWNFEANNTQNIFNTLMEVYGVIKEGNSSDIIKQLGKIGRVLDYSRNSQVFSESFKDFFIGYFNSGKIDFGTDTEPIIQKMLGYIDSHWDPAGNDGANKDFSFETTFELIQETAEVAEQFKDGTPTLDNLKDVLGKLVEDESGLMKDVVKDLLEDNVIGDMFGEDNAAVKDVIGELVDRADKDSLEKDLDAAQKVVEVLESNKNGDKTITEEQAGSIVDALIESDNIMDMLDERLNSGSQDSDLITDQLQNLDDTSKEAFESALQAKKDELAAAGDTSKDEFLSVLDKLFGKNA